MGIWSNRSLKKKKKNKKKRRKKEKYMAIWSKPHFL